MLGLLVERGIKSAATRGASTVHSAESLFGQSKPRMTFSCHASRITRCVACAIGVRMTDYMRSTREHPICPKCTGSHFASQCRLDPLVLAAIRTYAVAYRADGRGAASTRRHRYGGYVMNTYCESCGSTENLCVDHDHACCPGRRSCGKCVRGTLCQRCNKGIFGDDIYLMESKIQYLEDRA
jgi:hypothetical protein